MATTAGLWWLPFITAALLPFTFLTSYVWSVMEGHTEPDFPYISSTGTHEPESCFFGQMLNITAMLLGVLVWLRHRMILDFCDKNVTRDNLSKSSRISSYFGYMAAFGISMVGNFQVTKFRSLHLLGAIMAFFIGNIYMWIEAVISYSLVPRVNSLLVARVRLISSITGSIMFLLTVVFSILHSLDNKEVAYWSPYNYHEREESNSWGYHVTATASEWILAACFYVVIMSFVPEMKRVTIHTIVVELNRDRRQVRDKTDNVGKSTETIVELERM